MMLKTILFLLLLGVSTNAFQITNINSLGARNIYKKNLLFSTTSDADNVHAQGITDEKLSMGLAGDSDNTQTSSRRSFFAATLIAAGTIIGGDEKSIAANAAAVVDETSDVIASDVALPWKINPVNKRFGTTVVDAEKAGYTVAFVTYLSRFLLSFDENCQRWWFTTKFPKNANAYDVVERLRINQFASFSASVEVGLQGYEGPNGPEQLLEDLVGRYGTYTEQATNPDDTSVAKTQQRLARSKRRHLALLFGLLEKKQPVKALTKLLASVDNGGVTSVKLMNETLFDGYEIGKEPQVVIPMPAAGDEYVQAEGRAVLKPTGKLLRLDIVAAGSGYNSSAPPVITISNPQVSVAEGTRPAKVQAKVATKGPNKGSIESIKLIDPGFGYFKDGIQIEVSPPSALKGGEGEAAVLSPVLNMAVESIEMTKAGTGYAIEKPLKVFLEQSDSSTAESTTRKSRQQEQQVLAGFATTSAEKSSFTAFRRDSDKKKISDLEEKFETKYNMKPTSGIVSGSDSELPPLPFWSGKSSSAELLRLLPAGIGLEYDSSLKRYVLAADTDFLNKYPAVMQQVSANNRPLGFEYGPRGRAPIERDMQLSLSTYARFALAGAVCGSGVHLALTPLDVVKTKAQVDPAKYPNIVSSLGTVWNVEGPATLFTGWIPTLLGNFVGSGTLYTLTEFTRRSFTEAAGVDASSLEVPIILVSAAIASALGAAIICPFEAVRIRTVAQPEYADNSVGVLKKMLKEEGVGSLVNAIPVFLAKNIPYAMVKFVVFDLSTEMLYEQFPAAQEELKLSLLVSLVGGILGGTCAAIVSNPADAVISELKKAKSDISPIDAAQNMIERAGPSAFFVGLPLRMVFYSLNASMIFVAYDAVRFLLGIGADDLKLYLDVLGGSLSGNPLV